ncbi:MAG: SMP-30/gluconolactonase/LRE family protein [Proteobacteria bacterium]|nr:SMP-30/gluconolactonase/LRE family protein [Pseudomonadota bacterium]
MRKRPEPTSNISHRQVAIGTLWLAVAAMSLGGCGGGTSSGDKPDAGPFGGNRPDAARVKCGTPPSLPAELSATLTGFTGSEDFAFDAAGNLVSSDSNGNLTRQPRDGAMQLLAPNIGDMAGMRFLPNGDLVVAVVDTGSVVRIAPSGSHKTILSGIAYPNGVEVGDDGFVYVTEHEAGKLRRINPDNGEFTVIGGNMMNPNGVSFSPDYRTLYIASFGSGIVYSVTADGAGSWGSVHEFARTPGGGDGVPAACQGATAGQRCSAGHHQPGLCQAWDGGLVCDTSRRQIPAAAVTACTGSRQFDSCSFADQGTNYSGECEHIAGTLTCYPHANEVAACTGKTPGDSCQVDDLFSGQISGHCQDLGQLFCFSGDSGEAGMLDGLTVDACGFVYVTEYTVGKIWRFAPAGGPPELVIDLDSSWIPNLHWGVGVGGWDADKLYVMDRDLGRVFELAVGNPEKRRVYP